MSNNYKPDPLQAACWSILQALIKRGGDELLYHGYQNAAEADPDYSYMNIQTRVAQGQDVQLGFNESNGEYFYKGQRHGELIVVFVGDLASWRADNLVSGLKTETAKDLFRQYHVPMFNPQSLGHTPFKEANGSRWLEAATVSIGYRTAYTYSDTVGIIDVVDLTAHVADETIHKKIDITTITPPQNP